MIRTLALLAAVALPLAAASELTIRGRCFYLDGHPFPYTGVSFFNAIYNPAFHASPEARREWFAKFRRYGVNVFRVWSQWDNKRGFVDSCPACSLYEASGSLRPHYRERLRTLAADAAREGFVIELVLFSQESWRDGIKLSREASMRGIAEVVEAVRPFRNVTIQIWNEFDENAAEYAGEVKRLDPQRLVTNSPGGAGVILASEAEMRILDFYTPHTTRQRVGRPWMAGPAELHMLLERYGKPVVDDEPARNGTRNFGGPGEDTYPADHIVQIFEDWRIGAYPTYHHDMIQLGAGAASVPPSGIPDPEFSPYHRKVFEFLALRDRYATRSCPQ